MKRLGTMIDCSRNAVMKKETVFRWIDVTSAMGYNCLMLYTEDTYEMTGHPYFGYLRGRYTQEEIREIDAYAAEKGMELIPCIQTLAHLRSIFNWPVYDDVHDCHDILLVGEEKTYQLIDDMLRTCAECFRSRTVNVGMDEAMFMGLGKYLQKNGYENRTDILLRHVQKVAEIAKKYGQQLIMWGDMFFYLAERGHSLKDVKEKIPQNVQLIYWDYNSREKHHYKDRLHKYRRICKETWFAGGVWSWTGFTPHNGFTLETAKAALPVMHKEHVENIFYCLWGDDGAECSKFATLPAVYTIARMARGETDMERIKKGFEDMFGFPYDLFMQLDLPMTPEKEKDFNNAEKKYLYNDPLMGIHDGCVNPDGGKKYMEQAQALEEGKLHPAYGYLFDTQQKLCQLMALKYGFGVRLRKAYQEEDHRALIACMMECETLLEKMENFYTAFEKQWHMENKPHGFDIQDLRLGGAMRRMEHVKRKISQYLHGATDRIPELEETILPAETNWYTNWEPAVTPNVIYHIFE